MASCAGVKPNGGRCTATPLPGEDWCYGHHPDYAEQRRRNAAKSHKTRSASPEIASIKQSLSKLAKDVLEGRKDRGDAAVAGQLYNTLIRAIGMELKVKEQLEIEERIAELEALLAQREAS